MNMDDTQFDVYGGSSPEEYQPAKTWLYCQLGLKEEFDEDFAALNRDADRVFEFFKFYFTHSNLCGTRRALCADLVVESVVDLIEPEPVDGYVPAPDGVAQELVQQLLADPHTRYYLLASVCPEMREAGYYKRLSSLVDRFEKPAP